MKNPSEELKYDPDFLEKYEDDVKRKEFGKLNREDVLNTVRQDGFALNFASPEFKADKEVVLEAVKNNGRALQFASPKLKLDKNIVLEAVRNDGMALEFAHPLLASDAEVAMAAVINHGAALIFVSQSLQSDEHIIRYAFERSNKDLKAAKNKFEVAGAELKFESDFNVQLAKKISPKK
jgi:hypothetical protein